LLTGRKISAPLRSQNCDDELTTRVNYNIQGTGQGIMDIIMTTTRIFATMFEIPYNMAHFIHDELFMETHFMDRKNFCYISQLAHLFSKALLCHKVGLECMPQNDMWFKTIEIDTHLRKSPNDLTITPSNREIVEQGWSVKAEECIPEDWLKDLILNTAF
jgi:DNA polymerase gamma 1